MVDDAVSLSIIVIFVIIFSTTVMPIILKYIRTHLHRNLLKD
jgi:hypothetical protein